MAAESAIAAQTCPVAGGVERARGKADAREDQRQRPAHGAVAHDRPDRRRRDQEGEVRQGVHRLGPEAGGEPFAIDVDGGGQVHVAML